MSDWMTARFADGPAVVAWLEERGIEPPSETLRKRIGSWRAGTAADFYAIDRLLVGTRYGPWELPDGVWLAATSHRQIALGPDWTPPKPKRKRPRPAYRSRYRPLQRKRWLVARYVDRGLTTADIARELGCNGTTVRDALIAHGIPLRAQGTRRKVAA